MSGGSFFGDGADTMVLRARPAIVALIQAKHAPIYVVLFLPPAVWAMAEQQWFLATCQLIPAGLAALAFIATSRLSLPSDLRGIEALVSVALIFLISALLSVPSFVSLGMPPIDALFEAVSGATTTGLSVAPGPDDWPFAAHFFRSWLQWCGGLVMATAVLALILPTGVASRRLGRAGIDEGDRVASTRRQARQLLGVYVGLTVVLTALTVIAIPNLAEAFVLTLSGISTAGFAPRSDSLASYTILGQSMVILSCIVGAISLLTFVFLTRRKPGEAWSLGSIRRVLIAIFCFSALYVVILVSNGVRDPAVIYGEVLNLISGLTTAGYSTGGISGSGVVLLLFVVAMAVGGDLGSTAGGLKLARLGLLIRALRHALRAPALPDSAVAPLRQNGRKVDQQAIVSVLALVIVYLLSALALWMHFLAHDFPALPSLFETVSTLSTVGLSTGLVGPDLPDDLKLSVTFAMWLGRLEFIAVLVFLSPGTWIKRR